MAKVTKRVRLTCEVEVTFDESLLPNDEWRIQFGNIEDLDDLASHLAYNNIVERLELSQIDGFADQDDEELEIMETGWDVECLR